MSLPTVFEEDRQELLEQYRTLPNRVEPPQTAAGFPIHVFEWMRGASEDWNVESVEQYRQEISSDAIVRVVLIPRDVPRPDYVRELIDMFDQCDIPNSFISESLRNVSQSFGHQSDITNGTTLWFHILSKDAVAAYQYNPIWTKAGVVLRVSPQRIVGNNTLVAGVQQQPHISMYCFGGPTTFATRMNQIREKVSSEDMLRDPYMLVGIIIEEMHRLLDEASWTVADNFRPIELNTLGGHGDGTVKTGHAVSFSALHNLAKHAIFLQENCDSALATLEYFREFHKSTLGPSSDAFQRALEEKLAYQKTLFESTRRRLTSLDRRMSNIIQLSFHLVTQTDSQIMKTIALPTLIFLPLSTVATVFGTEFFHLEEQEPYRMRVSRDFWLLWLVAGPLTIVVLTTWRYWNWGSRAELIGQMPGSGVRYLYEMIKRVERYLQDIKLRKGKQSDQGHEIPNMP